MRGDERAVREALEAPGEAWAPRGMGRSYGDAAVNAGGGVLQLDGGGIEIDASTGRAVCTADVTIDDLIARAVPLGYFVPVTPGTRFVSLGGAVAA
ncbi:MAG: FAD-binding protein, partial [Candidatus Nanopelagicales bacterium]